MSEPIWMVDDVPMLRSEALLYMTSKDEPPVVMTIRDWASIHRMSDPDRDTEKLDDSIAAAIGIKQETWGFRDHPNFPEHSTAMIAADFATCYAAQEVTDDMAGPGTIDDDACAFITEMMADSFMDYRHQFPYRSLEGCIVGWTLRQNKAQWKQIAKKYIAERG